MKPAYLVHPSMKANTEKPAEKPKEQQAPMERQNLKGGANEKKPDDVKKFPRPLVSQEESKVRYVHSAKSNFEDPPSLFYNFVAKDEGNATCRHARSSIYTVPDNNSSFVKSKINFSVVSLKGIHPLGRASGGR